MGDEQQGTLLETMQTLVLALHNQANAINNLAASNEMLANSVVETAGSSASEEVDDEELPESL